MSQCEQNRDETKSRILAKLYEEHGDFIQSLLWFLLNDPQDREDVYQEVFLTLLMLDDLYKTPQNIKNMKGFLHRLVANKANHFLRTKLTQGKKFKEYVEHVRLQPTKDPFQEILDGEQAKKMIGLIQEHLPPYFADAILARFQHDYDAAKAAQEINVKKSTIIHNASMGIKKLRSIIQKLERAKNKNDGAEL